MKSKILNLIDTGKIDTITVDIFDTVIMRKIWPEDIQFIKVAKTMVPVLQKQISQQITTFEIYSWRKYARDELLWAKDQSEKAKNKTEEDKILDNSVDVDTNLEEWFSYLIDLFEVKYKKKIDDKNLLIQKLIKIEMKKEKELTSPNQKIITLLRQIKHTHPEIKIFFVSDMYLKSSQINELLEHHGCADIFDGGISSTEVQKSKHSGNLFYWLHYNQDNFQDIDLYKNLHIGDNKLSDLIMPENAGSRAIHYTPKRFRRFRTLKGKLVLKIKYRKQKNLDQKQFEKFSGTSELQKSSAQIFDYYGFLFAQPLNSFLFHIGQMANLIPEKTFLIVSSESVTFQKIMQHHFKPLSKNIKIAPKLNRKRSIKALIWTIAKQNKQYDTRAIADITRLGEISKDRKEIYQFILTKDYPVSSLQLDKQSESDFYKKLFHDIQNADSKYTKHLEDAYSMAISFLPSKNKTVVICDVGWGGTVQNIFDQFCKLHGHNRDCEGLYIGVHKRRPEINMEDLPTIGYLMPDVLSDRYRPLWNAVIWEYVYTNKPQFFDDPARSNQIQTGLDKGNAYFNQTKLNPYDFFHKVIANKIADFVSHPTRDQARVIGSLKFDMGFANPQILRILDTSLSKKWIIKTLFTDPKFFLKFIVSPNYWTSGYIAYYRLYGLKIILKIAGKIKKTNYL